MALRVVEIIVPDGEGDQVEGVLKDVSIHGLWLRDLLDGRDSVKILLDAGEAETVLDLLDKHFIWGDRARLLLYSVEATRPKILEPGEEGEPGKSTPTIPPEAGEKQHRLPERISRDELQEGLAPGAKVGWVYVTMVLLSAIIAAVGLIRNDVVILIGAMVIAPLLTPNMALAFGTTLGDLHLARRAALTTGVGMGAALFFAVMLGLLVPFDSGVQAFVARTQIGIGDLVLALAAGGAGALAFTTGVPAGLVGVMVAVALLPPAVVTGMLAGKGEWNGALGALLLLLGNIICVNLSATLVFVVQGIRPRTWWDRDRAKRSTWIASLLWGGLLASLVVIILLSR